jgi:biotin carboxylase
MEAAVRLGVEIVAASELPSTMQENNPSGLITLDFIHPQDAARRAAAFARQFEVDAVIPVDEDTAVAAAWIARELELSHNSVESASIAKNKRLMRETLRRAQVRVPDFWSFTLDDDAAQQAARVSYPCVVKPVFLSTSRGVMRADNEAQFIAAVRRLERILDIKDVSRRGGAVAREVLVEEFVPGFEVALEGLLTDGNLRVLALFDKPDPLNGPFFEETIYVTPSRLPSGTQQEIFETTQQAAGAMQLTRGPIHAELRVNDQGAWVIEVAARAIGGLCSRTLRFGADGSSLEELILRHALGEDVEQIEREPRAAAVMMIPVPKSGVLREVNGIEDARSIADIEDIVISAHITQRIAPPPEGASYLGFIFGRAETPAHAEQAVREAHARIEFVIDANEAGDAPKG